MSKEVTLTETEATAVLMLLKSTSYAGKGLSSEEGVQWQATLMNLGERIELQREESTAEQFALWGRLGEPSFVNENALLK